MTNGINFKAGFIILIIIFAVLLILPTIGSKQMEIILKPDATAEQIASIKDRFKTEDFQFEKKEDRLILEGVGINDAVMNEARIQPGVKDAKIMPHWAEKAFLAKQINLGLICRAGCIS